MQCTHLRRSGPSSASQSLTIVSVPTVSGASAIALSTSFSAGMLPFSRPLDAMMRSGTVRTPHVLNPTRTITNSTAISTTEFELRISAGSSDVRSEIYPLNRIGISDWTEMALNFDRKLYCYSIQKKKNTTYLLRIMSTHPSSSHRGRIVRPAVPPRRQCTRLRTGRRRLWVESGRRY